ncbi:hypothetical protein [Rickettsia endosymbiont of Ixodes pacificus]|uniref:hypothetical protein n=1 Tax=Rickettsia endosymbiont of Ixodes pacificus TaxID=1133329 RepID=UPI0012E064C5|nr:hypothetical protein [Rickettsia endosymbiont of Ixodes pacificus]
MVRLFRHCEKALLRGAAKPTVSPRGLTTGSIKTTYNVHYLSIFPGSRDQIVG